MISFIVIVAALALCIYDYRSSRDWQQATSFTRNDVLFRFRNRRYGAYEMRKSYNRLMATLVVGAVVLTAFTMGASAVYHSGSAFQDPKPHIDTSLLSLNAPPIEPIQTLPESVQIAPAEKKEAQSDEPKQPDKPAQPQENTSVADPSNIPTPRSETPPVKRKDKSKMTGEERARAFEEEVKASMGGAKERERIQREMEERKAQRERDAQNKKNNQKTTPPKKTEGGAMVNFNLEGRTVLKEGEDLPNPGYGCGFGTTGTVRVKITVLSNGSIVAICNNPDANPCLVELSLKYAKKSKLSPSSRVQTGWIEYTFLSQ